MYRVTKDLQDFALAHRLGKGYARRCKNLHGHNYALRVTLGSESLDQYDMVMDFGEIKRLFDAWVQDNWDHATMVSMEDKVLLRFLEEEQQRHYVVSVANQNSTAEYMSKFLFEKFNELLHDEQRNPKIVLLEVKIWETKDSFATYGVTF